MKNRPTPASKEPKMTTEFTLWTARADATKHHAEPLQITEKMKEQCKKALQESHVSLEHRLKSFEAPNESMESLRRLMF